jgi:hypothetical protein
VKDFVKNGLAIFNIILWTSLIVSCGSKEVRVDPELKPYEDWFFSMVDNSCSKRQYVSRDNYILEFTPGYSDPWRAGQCVAWPLTSKRHITVNRHWWDMMSEIDKKQLIAHELTHCFFNEGHSADPNHFMYYQLNFFYDMESMEEQVNDFIKGRCNAQ